MTEPVLFDSHRAELALAWTLRRYEVGQVRLPPGSRLSRALALMTSLNRSPFKLKSSDVPQLNLIRDALLTAYEHLVIAHAVQPGSGGCTDDMKRRIETSLGGADLEAGDKNPHARNMQFELFLGAVLSLGGVSVHFQEPDLRILYHGQTVGIAAKRLRGRGSVAARMKDACAQVEKWTTRGFVAISADGLAVQDAAGTRGRPIELVVPDLVAIDKLFEERKEVLARLVIVREFAWLPNTDPPRLLFGTRHHVRAFSDSIEDVSRAEEFFAQLMTRMNEELRRMKLAA